MKFEIFKKTTAALLAAAMVLGASAAFAGQGGNGGGGISRNGRYMTFYTAGFYTEQAEATADEVPQLATLANFFNSNQYLSESTKATYVSALMPSSSRSYYKVKPSTFTPEVRARLIAEFGRVMKVDEQQIALFAVTDTESKRTYLFPEFFSLTPIEQKAILFHEGYWIVHPKASYDDVIQAEMKFQAYLSQPASGDRLLRWVKATGGAGDVWTAAIRSDLATGALTGFTEGDGVQKTMVDGRSRKVMVGGHTLRVMHLFGQQFANCLAQGSDINSCFPFVTTNAFTLESQYPRSLFLKLVYDYASQKLISIDALYRDATGYYIAKEEYSNLLDSTINLDEITYNEKPTFSIRFTSRTTEYPCRGQCNRSVALTFLN